MKLCPNPYASENTRRLLNLLSSHLSTRKGCSGTEYVLKISGDTIEFSPNVYCFPDLHKRKQTDRMPILEHVLLQHMSDVLRSQYDTIFVDGIYWYKLSVDRSRRRWTRYMIYDIVNHADFGGC